MKKVERSASIWSGHVLCLVLLGGVIASQANAADAVPTNSRVRLLPWPKSVDVSAGTMKIGPAARIVVANADLRPLADIFRDELRLVAGLDLKVSDGPTRDGDIVLKLNPELRAGDEIFMVRDGRIIRSRDGAYRLTVAEVMTLEGFDYRAVAEGTATFLQAVERTGDVAVVPLMTINDWPHADFTGVMLDVARQLNTIEDIQRCVEVCRAYKIRYLQLHLTDDQAWTFPSATFPKLGAVNGSAHGGPVPQRYALEDLKALVRFANQRGVTLVPELELPGHSSHCCAALPDVFGYVPTGTNEPKPQGAMNIANPKLYPALDSIIGEMCDVFASSPYFHIGCDEVSGLGVVASTPEAVEFMKRNGLRDANELLSYFIGRVDEMVTRRGRRTMIWEGAANGVSKEIIHLTWDGNARTAERLIAQGIPTITVPWNLAGVPWHEWSMYHCNGSVLKRGDPVLGAMLPIWEQKGDVNLRWLRTGVAKRQERTWGPDTVIDPSEFEIRSDETDTVVDRMLYGFAIRHSPETDESLSSRNVVVPTTLQFATWDSLGVVRVTTDGSEPTDDSPPHSGPILIADNTTIRARLFSVKGQPVASTWNQSYTFSPLSLEPERLLPKSSWFADSMELNIVSRMKSGTIRYTLDGSAPDKDSPVFTEPVVLRDTAMVVARWFDTENIGRGNAASATYRKLATVKHAAVNKPVVMTITTKLEDPEGAAKQLVDGFLGRDGDWGSPEVVQLGQSDLEAVIDLGERQVIQRVVGRFIHCQEAGIYPARRVDVFTSEDGQSFRLANTAKYAVPQERGADGTSVREIGVDVDRAARYVKIVCQNNGQLPAWHKSPGVLGHLMLDEILVNPE